ncbi:Na+/H+ antiporter NhaC [Brachyspira pilosicoli]|uniref:Na+/H+ antiporter NhaC n=1 Tax=Brachyspira pilosicoli TaxID=52584 RepID=UPI001CA574AC|nr:Na+/H+ antiporter NhaC [Brachyspira pilosicoli]MBW5396745.1 Na+/H+ antiporter NhaC [Brachyspira pilosicoli]
MDTIKQKKKPTLFVALLPLIFMFVVLIVGLLVLHIDIKILLILCAAFTICISLKLGYTWKDIEEEIIIKLARAFPAIMILISVGLMIGAWVISGTIPYLVYIGLKIINPKFIIITSFLVTVILSVSTGTSWGSAGTVGAALISVAAGMGAPLPAVAGAIVAGAYFGDKMSPLSDSTNMSAIATNTNLYQHIGHMLYTTVPGFIVSCIVYLVAGFHFSSTGQIDQINIIINTLSQLFNLSMPVGLILLIPPVIVVSGSLLKKPTIPVMMISSLVAVLIAIFIQGFSISACANSMVNGFKMDMFVNPEVDINSLVKEVPNLLQRGGMSSMMNSALMAFCAFSFIGALTISGSLEVVISSIMKHIDSTGKLITLTILLGVLVITVIGEASVTFLMIGSLFRGEYIKRGLESKNLSRSLEDSITVVEPLVPWSLAGVYMSSTLGVATVQYAPWAVLCYTGVIFAIIWGFTGFGIAKINKDSDSYQEYLELNKQ